MIAPEWHLFSLEDIRAVGVMGGQDAIDDEHVNWFVSYAPEAEEDGGGHVVVATLHAAFSGGRVDATVGGRLVPVGEGIGQEALRDAIAASAALESLYDFARTIAKSVLGTLDISGALPYKSPDPELGPFEEADSGDDAVSAEVGGQALLESKSG